MRYPALLTAAVLTISFQTVQASTDIGARFDVTVDTLAPFQYGLEDATQWLNVGYGHFTIQLDRLSTDPLTGLTDSVRVFYKADREVYSAGGGIPPSVTVEQMPVVGSTSARSTGLSTELQYLGDPARAWVVNGWNREFSVAPGESASYGGFLSVQGSSMDFPVLGTTAMISDEDVTGTIPNGASITTVALKLQDGDDLLRGGLSVAFHGTAGRVTKDLDPATGRVGLTVYNPTTETLHGTFFSGSLVQLAMASPVPEPETWAAMLAGLAVMMRSARTSNRRHRLQA